jgi:hypothetical protein
MFARSSFNQDIGGWNIGMLVDIGCMFFKCESFSGNLGRWALQRPDLLPKLRLYLGEEQLQSANRWVEYYDRPN